MSTPDRKPPQFLRRDFLLGAAGGVAGGYGLVRAATAVAGPELTRNVFLPGANLSYAQQGEDLIIASLFSVFGIETPTYLDIGAYEPIVSNNTYLFYLRGSRGVLVEPNPNLTSKLRRVRPRDTTLAAGVGLDESPAADFYLMDKPQLHTFDKGQAERLQRDGLATIKGVVSMPLVGINRAIAENFGGASPDLISIDIEGLDFAVLKTLDFAKYRPKIICAETLMMSNRRHNPETLALLASHGYEPRGMTLPNTIFVDTRTFG